MAANEEKRLLDEALRVDAATKGNPPAPADQIHVRDEAGQFTPRTQQPPVNPPLCAHCGTPIEGDACPNGCA
jgi:hypothetical protein